MWRVNPFFDRPIAVLEDGTYVTPSPRALLQRLGPQGLYFTVLEALKSKTNRKEADRFASALGLRYEKYIGQQLHLLKHATIHHEITYDSSQKSVDYIIETDEVIVLVEVKSAAPDVKTRSGSFPKGGDVDRKLNRACDQISRTAKLMGQGHPKLPALNGRPLRGIVVTREDYFNLQMPPMANVVKPASVPTTVVSSLQLEYVLSALSDDPACGSLLLGAMAADTNRVKTHLNPLATGTNPLLKEVGDLWAATHLQVTQ